MSNFNFKLIKKMKYKYLLFLTFIFGVCVSTTNAQLSERSQYPCTAHSETDEAVKNDPDAKLRMAALEKFTDEFIKQANANRSATSSSSVPPKVIPIVFHVIHTGGAENITVAQIEDAVRIISEDWQKMNADTASVLPAFQPIIGNPNVVFRKATIDPQGRPSDGITRVYSSLHTGGADADIKALINWDSRKYVNVYCVSNIQSGAGAYAYLPGSFTAGSPRDGIVCRVSQLGSIGQSSSSNAAARTLTHELGHHMNLRHTWGATNTPGLPTNCNDDDLVDDTPNTVGVANSGCDKTFTSCGNLSNVENYMDYADCERMFTQGQVDRMEATLNSSIAGRNNLWSPANLLNTGTEDGHVQGPLKPIADFYLPVKVGCTNSNINISNNVYNGIPTVYEWTMPGATPSTSNDPNPVVTYAAPGSYAVKLKVTNAAGADSVERTGVVEIIEAVATTTLPVVEGIESAAFPDNGWKVINPSGTPKWTRTTAAAYSGSSSVFINNFTLNAVGEEDDMWTPPINFTGVDKATLRFKRAYAQRNDNTTDRLIISVSKDCGVLFQQKYSKAGATIATVPDKTTTFTPASQADWAADSIDLSAYKGFSSVIVRFRNVSDLGNNLYLDDIEIFTNNVGVDNFMRDNLNLSISPNPFDHTSNVKFFLTANANVSLKVYDLLGKEVAVIAQDNLEFGEHSYEINQSNSGISDAGIYFVKLSVNGFEKVQKIVFTK
jgi:PKD repeat protein